MTEQIRKLTVKYNEAVVGYLAEVEAGRIGFQYEAAWLKNGFSVSPFSLPLASSVYYSEKRTFGGLFGVFHDSLPDGWGELLVKRMLAAKGINYDKLSPLTKLALINGNGLGGLTYEPTLAEEEKACSVHLDALAADVQRILNDEVCAGNDLDEVYLLGGSSGGARPKAHIRIDGAEWIVKFPSRTDPVNIGEKEYAANRAAQRCGIHINECKLFPSERCKGYFGAKRFDRAGGKRVHMVSLAALLETTHRIPNLDYLHLFQVVQNICADKNELYETFRRMVFNVLYGNRDDHGKNFSFLYNEKAGSYTLSPAYDLTEVTDKPEHEMTVNGNGKPTTADLLAVARIAKLSQSKCQTIFEEVKSILTQ